MRRFNPGRTGFTFVELMLVVVIISIVLVTSIPNFRRTYENIKVRSLTSNISKLMRYGRERAIVEGVEYQLKLSSGRDEFWMEFQEDEDAKDFVRVKGKYGRGMDVPDNIKIKTEPEGIKGITFYPDGRSDKVKISLEKGGEKLYTITTQKGTGYVKVVEE